MKALPVVLSLLSGPFTDHVGAAHSALLLDALGRKFAIHAPRGYTAPVV